MFIQTLKVRSEWVGNFNLVVRRAMLRHLVRNLNRRLIRTSLRSLIRSLLRGLMRSLIGECQHLDLEVGPWLDRKLNKELNRIKPTSRSRGWTFV